MQQPTLRAAHSTPFIHTPQQHNKNDEKENSNEQLAHSSSSREDQKLHTVQFNTGCSSSSTDLSQLALYNESADQSIVDQWTNLYKKQRHRQPPRDSPASDSANEHFFGESYSGYNTTPQSSTQSINEETPHHITTNAGGSSMYRRPVNRSLDVLPTIEEGFRVLEKCVSVEFPSKTLIPPSSLVRSREVPNLVLAESEYE